MKVLFVNSIEDAQSLNKPMTSLGDIQMGISYISAFLKSQGHTTAALVLSPSRGKSSFKVVDRVVGEFDPRVIAFTTVYSQYRFIADIARHIRQRWPGRFHVIGGPHPSLNPDRIAMDLFDAVCVGEGEMPMLEVVQQLEQGAAPSGIRNLWIRRGDGTVEKNPTRPFLEDLDSLPFPDRGMWEPWINERAGAMLSVLLGRGCPFRCTYCSNHALAELACGRYVRFRSAKNILEEIRFLHGKYPDKIHYYLEVETISLDKKWLTELTDQLREFNAGLETKLTFGCNFRVARSSVDPEIFDALKRANFISINIGLESGSERLRKEVLNRRYTNDEFLQAVALARERGIRVNVYNLIGIPGESLKEHLETVDLNRRACPDWIFKSIFFPYPGTKLSEVCISRGLVQGELDGRLERRHAILDLPEFPKKAIQKAYILFEYRVYRGLWPLHKRLVKTARNVIKSSRLASWLYSTALRIPWIDKVRARLEKDNT